MIYYYIIIYINVLQNSEFKDICNRSKVIDRGQTDDGETVGIIIYLLSAKFVILLLHKINKGR